ncbi:cellulose synthase subunit BcsC-related outer membrane protein [Undibacterium sp. TS12]|uniref:cellulose synthase subunit BcsC-related outer membrane protein n=1 Tax=Undibacterium sp. TS12 TaxID=2908202 RepID=UPI00240A64B2|nr:cellulose synthase subunit BcsC-related outer membrane protein [Undibacterium sp. TS12]
MIFKKKALALALLTVYLDSGQALANTPLTQQLKEQAQFWAQRGKDENAADAWRKILKIEPSNAEALLALVIYESKAGNPSEAKTYYSRLRGAQATITQLRAAEDAYRRGSSNGAGGQLEEARKLAKQGDVDSAVEAYKQMGDPSKLKGDAAFEYFQVLAGTKAGYPDAKRGLEKLMKESPGNTRYALAYAQVLTYREPTRLEGIAALEQLTAKADVGKQAGDSWRQALSWMALKNDNAKYFRRYLDKFPDDQAMSEKLAGLNRPAAPAVTEEKSNPAKVLAAAKQTTAVKAAAEVKENIAAAPKAEVQAKSETKSEARSESKPEHKSAGKTEAQAKASGDNLDKARTDAFKALDANDLKTAEAAFQTLIKSHPKESAGYGGLGLVRMRQDEFVESRTLLHKAVELSPSNRKDQWKPAFDRANYWGMIADARTAFEDSNSAKGISLLRKAIEMDPKEAVGILQLGDALLAENDAAGAEANFRLVLKSDPKNQGALDSMIGLLAQQKRIKDLEELSAYMSPRQMAVLSELKAGKLWDKAKAAEAAGDIATAQTSLEDAVLITPDNPWLRMALAKIYLGQNAPGAARALMDAMANVENPQAEALYASALLSAMQQLWWEGLMTLERLPVAARKPEMVELQKRLWTRVQVDRLNVFVNRGDTARARELLGTIEGVAGNEPEFVGIIAAFHMKVGDPGHGLALVKRAVDSTPNPPAGVLLQYGMALLRANQEAEALAVMRRITEIPKLSAEEVTDYKDLQRIVSMRYSERAREAGDYATAFNFIQPMLMADPDDNLLLLTLARIYSSSGDTESAKDLYARVLQAEPQNPEVLQGLVTAAIQARDFSSAEQHLATLMQLQPDNPRFISLAGNVARAQGNNGKAMEYFRQALAMEQAQRPNAGMGANGIRLVAQNQPAPTGDFSVNPFSDRNGRAQAVAMNNQPVQAGAGNPRSALFAPVGVPLQQVAPQYAPPAQAQYMQPQYAQPQYAQPHYAQQIPQQQYAPVAPQYQIPQLPASTLAAAQNQSQSSTAPAPMAQVAAAPVATIPQLQAVTMNRQAAPVQQAAAAPQTVPPYTYAGTAAGVSNAAVQGGASGNVSSASGTATVYQIPPANVTRSPLTQAPLTSQVPQLQSQSVQKPQTGNYYDTGSGGAGTASSAPVVPYIPPKASYNSNATPVPVPQQYAQYATGSNTNNTVNRSKARVANVSAEEAALQKEIDAINELSRTEVSVEVAGRSRSGEKGLSALNDIETPIEAQISTLGLGQFGLKIIPVLADAGTLYLNDTNVAGQFGRNAILVERAKFAKVPFTTIARQQGLSNVASLDEQAKGVALNLSYELAGIKADIGASPIGFPVQNVVGGLRWSGQSDGAGLGVEIARRSVTDSYLSYAGAKDSLYGLTWGGVTKTGGKLDTSYDGEDGGVYASLGYYSLTGKNVAKNTMAEFGAGAYWRAYKTNDFSFTTGLGLTSFFYNKNLRYFSYGHGGYFSPKSYVAVGLPLDIAGRKGKFAYQLGASLGVQHFREVAAAYYPNSPLDQAELEQFAAANPTINIQTSYPGQSKTAFAFKLGGAAEYQLTPHLFLGGKLSADNSGDFNDTTAAIYLRYSFEPRKSPIGFPPVAPKAYYQGN